ncbi:hypothetical protein [Helicobacter sp. UBA3407]|nr:hypothetical protein [Helicobacter sp. UBA3407]
MLLDRVDCILAQVDSITLAEDVLKSFVVLGLCERAVGIPQRFYVYCANVASSTGERWRIFTLYVCFA